MEYGETEKRKEFNNNNDSGAENGSVKDQEILVRHGWEIDLLKLIIKSMIARDTFGIVHRIVYDGLDVAVSDTGSGRQLEDFHYLSLSADPVLPGKWGLENVTSYEDEMKSVLHELIKPFVSNGERTQQVTWREI